MSLNKTKIDWVKNPDGSPGYTFNPITGCLNNCDYCYARKLANTRLRERYLANTNILRGYTSARGVLKEDAIPPSLDPFYPRFWEDKLMEPCRGNRKGKGIFVCSMSDLFGIGIPEEWTKQILNVIKITPENRYYLLTKQPQNLIKFSPFPDNCWVGVSVCNEQMWLRAIVELWKIEAGVKYISFEPLLEGLDPATESLLKHPGIKWVIIGAQTKPYKPPKIEWVEEIIHACNEAKIPYFIKNNLMPLMKAQSRNHQFLYIRQEVPR